MKIARGLVVGIVIAAAVVIRDADAAVAPVAPVHRRTVAAAAPQTLKRPPADDDATPSTTGPARVLAVLATPNTTGLAQVLAVHITAETVSSVIVGPPIPVPSDAGPTTSTTPAATNPRTTTRVRRTTVPPVVTTSTPGTAPFVFLDPPAPVAFAPAPTVLAATTLPSTTLATTPVPATPVPATTVPVPTVPATTVPAPPPGSPSVAGPFPTVLIKPAKAGMPFSISPAPTQPFVATATTATTATATATTAPFVPLTLPPAPAPGQIVGVIVLTPDTVPSAIQPVIAAVAAPKTTTTKTTATTTTSTRTSLAPTTIVPETTSTAPAPPVTDTTGSTTPPTTKAPITYTFAEPVDPPPAPNPRAADVVALALTHVGEPYVWGGEGTGGWDCSGLSMIAWASVGVRLTHNSAVQFSQTARVSRTDIQPGDLVFYGSPIHHLGIFIGDGKMVEAAREGVPVRISSIKRKDLVGIGRVR